MSLHLRHDNTKGRRRLSVQEFDALRTTLRMSRDLWIKKTTRKQDEKDDDYYDRVHALVLENTDDALLKEMVDDGREFLLHMFTDPRKQAKDINAMRDTLCMLEQGTITAAEGVTNVYRRIDPKGLRDLQAAALKERLKDDAMTSAKQQQQHQVNVH